MKTKHILNLAALLGVVFTADMHAQSSAFTYQGQLTENGSPATGLFDFTFTLYDADSGGTGVVGPATNSPVAVSNGLFTVTLDFGAGVFDGSDRWMEIAVARNGGGPFTALSPRQPITSAPYAIHAATASNLIATLPASQLAGLISSANLAGTYANAVSFENPANVFAGNGAGLTSLNASLFASGTVPDARLSANVSLLGQSIETAELGDRSVSEPKLADASVSSRTLDAGVQSRMFSVVSSPPPFFTLLRLEADSGLAPAIELRVRGLRALRLEDNGDGSDPDMLADGAPNVIGGAPNNFVAAGVVGATIAGGGATQYWGVTLPNAVLADYGAVVGGYGNTARGKVSTAMGESTTASGELSTAMGSLTTASGFASTAMGARTTASGGSSTAMGWNTTASGSYSTAMGYESEAADFYAVAAGRRARANHTGAFVWADSRDFDFSSTVNNGFYARCTGGVRFTTGINSSGGSIAGVVCPQGESAWESVSDRNAKQGFQSINPREVLEKVAAMPITRWSYKANPANEHIGPVAQDFYAAFGLGSDDKHISTIDADGVALAAIQGLNHKTKERSQRAEIRFQKLEAENAELKSRLAALEKTITTLNPKGN